jgi:hypothetical protein
MGSRKIGAAELTERRFPPPWIVEELEACFYVCDSTGQKLAYVYFEDEPGRRAAAKLLTKDEARAGSEHRQAAGAAPQVVASFEPSSAGAAVVPGCIVVCRDSTLWFWITSLLVLRGK